MSATLSVLCLTLAVGSVLLQTLEFISVAFVREERSERYESDRACGRFEGGQEAPAVVVSHIYRLNYTII